MAESEKKTESIEEASANPNADAPKKNAVAAEPSHLSNDAEDLGAPVVKPTDSNPDGTKKVNKVSDAVSKSAQVAGEPSHLKAGYHEETDSEDEVVESKEKDVKKDVEEEEVEKEGMHMKAGKHMKAGYKKSVKAGHCEETDSEIDVKDDIDALVGDADLSEEFKQKAATIFEAAINSKVKAEQERLQSEYDTKFEEESKC